MSVLWYSRLRIKNILFVDKRLTSPVKLADLGVAVKKGPRGICGCAFTPGYASPEVLDIFMKKNKRGFYTERCDMFSFGVVLVTIILVYYTVLINFMYGPKYHIAVFWIIDLNWRCFAWSLTHEFMFFELLLMCILYL